MVVTNVALSGVIYATRDTGTIAMKLYLLKRNVDLAGIVVAAKNSREAQRLVSNLPGSWPWKCRVISNVAHPTIKSASIIVSSINFDDDDE